MRNTSLARGATVMVISVAIAKVLGILYIVPLTILIGRYGLGIYSNAYSLFAILLTVATSGFPTAMGKVVSERLALRRYADVEQIYRVTMRTLLVLAIALSVLMWFAAPLYSHLVALRDPAGSAHAIVLAVRALAPAVLLVPLMSGYRGYLQGFQRLEPSGWSQAVEQLFRVIAMIVGAFLVVDSLHLGIPAGAAAATFGAFVGAVAGLILLVVAVRPLRRNFRQSVNPAEQRRQLRSSDVRRMLWRVGLPVSLGSLVVPISGLVDSLTVQNLLMSAGYSLTAATAAYGVLSRQAFQLIQLPLAFAMAIGASVLPSIAESRTTRNQAAIQSTVTGTIRSMFFMSFPIAASLLVLGRPIDILLFHSTDGAIIISGVSFMGILSSLELVSTYMLQGLDKMYRPVRNMFFGVFIKLVLNLSLIPVLHILGAAIATTVGYLFSSTLNVMAVRKYGHVHFSVWALAGRLLLTTAPLCAVLLGTSIGAWHIAAPLFGSGTRSTAAVQVVLAIAIGAVVYIAGAILTRAVTAAELRRLPWIGHKLARIADRTQAVTSLAPGAGNGKRAVKTRDHRRR